MELTNRLYDNPPVLMGEIPEDIEVEPDRSFAGMFVIGFGLTVPFSTPWSRVCMEDSTYCT